MYNKIICEKSEIYLCTDIGEKLKTVNDIRMIEKAKLDNDMIILNQEKVKIYEEMDNWYDYKTKSAISTFVIVLGCSVLLLLPIFRQLINVLIHAMPIFKLINFVIPAGMILSIANYFILDIPKANHSIEACEQTINYIEKKEQKIMLKKENISKLPKLALIREGQEFDIKIDKDIPQIIEMLMAYYTSKDMIEKDFLFFTQLGLTKDQISEIFESINRSSEQKVSRESLQEVIEEVYNNTLESDKDIKIRKRVK